MGKNDKKRITNYFMNVLFYHIANKNNTCATCLHSHMLKTVIHPVLLKTLKNFFVIPFSAYFLRTQN